MKLALGKIKIFVCHSCESRNPRGHNLSIDSRLHGNDNSKMKKQRGTALIVTVLLAGVISAIAFGMTKIALNEYFVGSKSEEGLQAYYAAQAGVEDALMRFKFHDKANLEIPDSDPYSATRDSTQVLRVYVNKEKQDQNPDKASLVDASTPPELNADNYVYDLKVWYKEKCLGDDGCVYDLGKDKSVLLDVSEAQNPIVFWQTGTKVGDTFTPTTILDAKLWYRLSDPITPGADIDPTGQYRGFLTYLAAYNDSQNPDPRFVNVKPLPAGSFPTLYTREAQVLKFKAFLTQEGQVIRIKVRPQPGDVLGGPTTQIESTGYFGGTAKKIEVSVDRESKSILSIFDYVLYSGNGNLP